MREALAWKKLRFFRIAITAATAGPAGPFGPAATCRPGVCGLAARLLELGSRQDAGGGPACGWLEERCAFSRA